MNRTLNGRLMREWVQVCRQEDHGKCSAGDADRMVQTKDCDNIIINGQLNTVHFNRI